MATVGPITHTRRDATMNTTRRDQIISRIEQDSRIKGIRFGGTFLPDDLPTAVILDDDHHIDGMWIYPAYGWEAIAAAISKIEVIA